MSDCTRYADDLKALVDGELPLARRWAVQRHVAGCTQCRADSAALRQIGDGLRLQKPEPLSAELRARILASIPDGSPAPVRRPMPRRLSFAIAGSAAAIAGLVFVFGPATRQFLRTAPESVTRAGGAAAPPVSAPMPATSRGDTANQGTHKASRLFADEGTKVQTPSALDATRSEQRPRSAESNRRAKTLSHDIPASPPAPKVSTLAANLAAKATPSPLPAVREVEKPALATASEDVKRQPLLRERDELRAMSTNATPRPSEGVGYAPTRAVQTQTAPSVNAPASGAAKPAPQDRGSKTSDAAKPAPQDRGLKTSDGSAHDDNYSFAKGASGVGGRAAGGQAGPVGTMGERLGGFGGGGGGVGAAGGGFGRGLGTQRADGAAPQQSVANGAATGRGANPTEPTVGKQTYRDYRPPAYYDLAAGTREEQEKGDAVLLGLVVTDVMAKRAAISDIARQANGQLVRDSLSEQKKELFSEEEQVIRLRVESAKVSAVLDKLERLGEVTQKIVAPPLFDVRAKALANSQNRLLAKKDRGEIDKSQQLQDSEALLLRQENTRRSDDSHSQTRLQGIQPLGRRKVGPLATITVKLKEKRPASRTAPAARPPSPSAKK